MSNDRDCPLEGSRNVETAAFDLDLTTQPLIDS